MVGRAGERDALSAAYARARTGQSQIFLVTGPAGIGKTRLVEDLRVSASDAQVLTGESAPLAGAALAYGPFVDALRDHAGGLLDEDQDHSDDVPTQQHRLFVRVLGALTDLAARAPVLLVLEDLHWADESSRELLDFLAVRLREQPIMVLATLRDDELSSGARRWLAELQRRPRVLSLRLVPLSPAEIGEVVADLMPADASADARAAVISGAEGNPLYARELASAGPGRMPASIADAVLGKAAGLEPEARALIDQVSVADGGMSHDLLAATLALPEASMLAAARAAVDSGLLVSEGDGYTFGHALARQVIYAEILPGERRGLHLLLAEALADEPDADPGLLARYWQLAGCPDRAAAAAALAARRAVAVGAYPEAATNYALAIELADWLPSAGPDLLEEAARAANWAGDARQAATWIMDALAQSGGATPAERARRLERLGRYRWETGDRNGAVEATGQAMAILGDEPPSGLQARVLAALGTLQMLIGELDAAEPLAVQAVSVAQQAGADAEQAHGLATMGIIKAEHGDLDGGLADLQLAFTLAVRAGSVEDTIRAAANRAYLLYRAGRFAETVEAARAGRSAVAAMGAPPALTAGIGNNAAAALVASGRWAEADQLLAELVAESAMHWTRYLQLLQLELAVDRGETGRAADLAATLRMSPDDPRIIGPLHACLAEQALNADDLAVAAVEVSDGLAAVSGAELANEEIRLLAAGAWLAADLALLPQAARPRDIPDGWPQLAATFAERAGLIVAEHGAGQPDLAAFGTVVAAEDARRLGHDTRATWRAAAEAWRVAGRPYREAYARLREAAAALKAGRREQAIRALTACQGLARELQAVPLLTRADDLARRARLAQAEAKPVRAAEPGTRFDLTDRELEILGYLVNGDSNRQIARALFISDRTVAVHVSRILGKLGVRNRTEAATVGARLGLAPDPAHTTTVRSTHAQLHPDRRRPDEVVAVPAD
jgi:DNA-binding CsgD family transcriptional regulator/tetratricopeptide (TPR) repeat protein